MSFAAFLRSSQVSSVVFLMFDEYLFCPKIMHGFKLKESRILRKMLRIDNLKGEDQNSSEAKQEIFSTNQAYENSRTFFYRAPLLIATSTPSIMISYYLLLVVLFIELFRGPG